MSGRTFLNYGVRIATVAACIALAVILHPILRGLVLIALDIALVAAIIVVAMYTVKGTRSHRGTGRPKPGKSHEPRPPSEATEADQPPEPPRTTDHSEEIEEELRDLKRRYPHR